MHEVVIETAIREGRPKERRGEREQAVYDVLDRLGMHYWQIDHAPVATVEDCAAVDAVLNAAICKNLLLRNANKSRFYLVMLASHKQLDTKALAQKLGSSRLSFASADDMEHLLRVAPGAVTVLALMNDAAHEVTLVLDEELLKQETFGCHPCVNTASLKLYTHELTERFLPHTGHTPVYLAL